uniref:Uncharacterized protein n=2 Tax=Opuntia streptacantha TaxID=393608 RepID=A0A7C8Z436_OPUST
MEDVSQQISSFCTLIKLKRFDDHTLRTLQVILESKDGRLLPQLRKRLKEFLRSESLIAIRQIANKPIGHVLSVLDFFVRAFAIVSDVESCLVLRYEALVMRDSKSISYLDLRVSCTEWLKFAQDAFDNGFYSITSKACENALLPFDVKGGARGDNLLENGAIMNKIQILRDIAIRLSATHAVQVQVSDYMKQKDLCLKQSSSCNRAHYPASISFRNGIKQRNVRNLLHLQNLRRG